MVTIEIDLNQIVDKSISAAVVLLCFFVGMRLLRLLAMQEGPKQRRMRPAAREPDPPATLKRPELVAPALQPEPGTKEQQPNGIPVPALALPPHIDATEDSFDRSLPGIYEARLQVASRAEAAGLATAFTAAAIVAANLADILPSTASGSMGGCEEARSAIGGHHD